MDHFPLSRTQERPRAAEDLLLTVPWRTGTKAGSCTIHAQPGRVPADDDPLVGRMETAALAAEAVAGHNALLEAAGGT